MTRAALLLVLQFQDDLVGRRPRHAGAHADPALLGRQAEVAVIRRARQDGGEALPAGAAAAVVGRPDALGEHRVEDRRPGLDGQGAAGMLEARGHGAVARARGGTEALEVDVGRGPAAGGRAEAHRFDQPARTTDVEMRVAVEAIEQGRDIERRGGAVIGIGLRLQRARQRQAPVRMARGVSAGHVCRPRRAGQGSSSGTA